MTPRDQAEQAAREWLIARGVERPTSSGFVVPSTNLQSLTILLLSRERAVLEDVAKHTEDEHEKDFGHRRVLGAEGEIVKWCRQQAKERA